MATTDLHFVSGALQPTKRGIRFLGGNVDDQVQINAAAVAYKTMVYGTISLWLMVPDNSGTYTAFSYGDASAVEYLQVTVEAGTIQVVLVDATTTKIDVNTAANTIKPHTWHHVAVVQDADILKIYIDGVDMTLTWTTSTATGGWGSLLDGLDSGSIGCAEMAGDGTLTQEFKGYISDVRVWGHATVSSGAALTATQVEEVMSGASVGSPINWWDLDQNVSDAGSGADDGTIVGDLIYSDANEFASRLTFLETVPLTADNISITAENGRGYAYCVLAA